MHVIRHYIIIADHGGVPLVGCCGAGCSKGEAMLGRYPIDGGLSRSAGKANKNRLLLRLRQSALREVGFLRRNSGFKRKGVAAPVRGFKVNLLARGSDVGKGGGDASEVFRGVFHGSAPSAGLFGAAVGPDGDGAAQGKVKIV